ncbi:MAG: hypothetical protein IPJ65_03250 [Archangiaceae bacterium]|nr:hypothetical protein [Archangiaceae bacterium]
MRRLPLVLLAIALPALAQQQTTADAGISAEAIDAGNASLDPTTIAGADGGAVVTDAGTPPPPVQPPPGVGRHFAFVWDAVGPAAGQSDVQLWVTPRYGRTDTYVAADVRAGVLQGLPHGFGLGFFVDATPTSTGVIQTPSVDARFTVRLQKGAKLAGPVNWGAHLELSAGERGFSFLGLLALDAQLRLFRIGLNLDAFSDAVFPGGARLEKTRARQTLGLSYTLTDGVSLGLELQNRLTWNRSTYGGGAFLIGPSVSYRGRQFWFSIALLPQVAAMKAEAQRGVGDPLELTDNERFTVRLSLGVVPGSSR